LVAALEITEKELIWNSRSNVHHWWKQPRKIIGRNPDLADLDQGDLKNMILILEYASILKNKLDFDPTQIGIQNPILKGLLSFT
jgi:hypothetical protein